MFVPIDFLKPILADLVREGRRAGPARPWLGVAADEVQGRLRRHARVAGRSGRSGGRERRRHHPRRRRRWRAHAGGVLRKVWDRRLPATKSRSRCCKGVDVKEIEVRSIDRVEYFRPRSTI